MNSIRSDAPQYKVDASRVYVVLPNENKLPEMSYPPHELVTFSMDIHDCPYVGGMFLSDDREQQQEFLRLFRR